MNYYVIIILSQIAISFLLTHINKIVSALKAYTYKANKKSTYLHSFLIARKEELMRYYIRF